MLLRLSRVCTRDARPIKPSPVHTTIIARCIKGCRRYEILLANRFESDFTSNGVIVNSCRLSLLYFKYYNNSVVEKAYFG